MPIRTGGTSRMSHPETPRPDELPDGVPAPPRREAERDDAGKLLPGPGTREQASRAAKAKHEAIALGRLTGLWEAPEGHAFQPYHRMIAKWRDSHLAQLAATVGGGEVGPGPSSIVASAALQIGASRFLFDIGAETGDAKLLLDASKLADASRQNLLAAHELAAKEAKSRPKQLPSFIFNDTDEEP